MCPKQALTQPKAIAFTEKIDMLLCDSRQRVAVQFYRYPMGCASRKRL
jgi:hypothetical protein